MHLLLLSNSTNHGSGYLAHAIDAVTEHLGGRPLTFVPYALADHDAYTEKVREAMAPHGVAVRGLHEHADPAVGVAEAEAVFVGGGNTFRLLATLQRTGALGALRTRVLEGMPYMGASAGTNIAAPGIRTTNDMPIVEPESFEALGLVPFQINPHYLDADPASTHNGETREQRLTEFLEENDAAVLGLREGAWLRVAGDVATVEGAAVAPLAPGPAILFRRGDAPLEVSGDVSGLLSSRPRFDVAG